ncbi:MAG: uracil phosphoribosyltransferase, partial [Lachnospiraceae bacterium]|nr:uracil phosphoribosyltransferase [Lachnospiraceae bacterium]
MGKVVIMDHPLLQHKIGIMRMKETSTKDFRDLVNEVAMLIYYEASRDLPLADKEIETPICKTTVKEIAG